MMPPYTVRGEKLKILIFILQIAFYQLQTISTNFQEKYYMELAHSAPPLRTLRLTFFYRKERNEFRRNTKYYKPFTILFTPFINSTVLKFINIPGFMWLNLKQVRICGKSKSFQASTAFISQLLNSGKKVHNRGIHHMHIPTSLVLVSDELSNQLQKRFQLIRFHSWPILLRII